MKIFINDIKELDTEIAFTQEDKWVTDAISRVDERIEGQNPSSLKSRTATGNMTLRTVDEVVVVSGDIDTQIQLLCSRCATAYRMPLKQRFSGLFCKDPVMAGVAHLAREEGDKSGPLKPVGQNKGFARHAHQNATKAEIESGTGDLDITYLAEEFIDLGDVLTEQLQLQVPFQPLCKESCKGICSNCGADLNVGRCACEKLSKTTPFSVLRDFKIKTN